jgi:hypothetical protein
LIVLAAVPRGCTPVVDRDPGATYDRLIEELLRGCTPVVDRDPGDVYDRLLDP